VHPEASRFVTCRSNDAPFRWVADRDGPTLEGGIVALLDRRIEGVHVDVDDLANPPLVHRENVPKRGACSETMD